MKMKKNEAKLVCLGFSSGPHDTIQCSLSVERTLGGQLPFTQAWVYWGLILIFFPLFLHLVFLETIQIIKARSIFYWEVSFADTK